MVIAFENAFLAQMAMLRSGWNIHFTSVTVVPVAVVVERILFDIGQRGRGANIRSGQKNRRDNRVDRGVRDHAEKEISNQIENDVQAEEKMTDFFVGEDIVVDRGEDDVQFEDDIHTDEKENEEDRN